MHELPIKTKKFKGKAYLLQKPEFASRTKAEQLAKKQRDMGHYARVISKNGKFCVYATPYKRGYYN